MSTTALYLDFYKIDHKSSNFSIDTVLDEVAKHGTIGPIISYADWSLVDEEIAKKLKLKGALLRHIPKPARNSSTIIRKKHKVDLILSSNVIQHLKEAGDNRANTVVIYSHGADYSRLFSGISHYGVNYISFINKESERAEYMKHKDSPVLVYDAIVNNNRKAPVSTVTVEKTQPKPVCKTKTHTNTNINEFKACVIRTVHNTTKNGRKCTDPIIETSLYASILQYDITKYGFQNLTYALNELVKEKLLAYTTKSGTKYYVPTDTGLKVLKKKFEKTEKKVETIVQENASPLKAIYSEYVYQVYTIIQPLKKTEITINELKTLIEKYINPELKTTYNKLLNNVTSVVKNNTDLYLYESSSNNNQILKYLPNYTIESNTFETLPNVHTITYNYIVKTLGFPNTYSSFKKFIERISKLVTTHNTPTIECILLELSRKTPPSINTVNLNDYMETATASQILFDKSGRKLSCNSNESVTTIADNDTILINTSEYIEKKLAQSSLSKEWQEQILDQWLTI